MQNKEEIKRNDEKINELKNTKHLNDSFTNKKLEERSHSKKRRSNQFQIEKVVNTIDSVRIKDFVDKSLFIKEWFEDINKVILITRPRRFGKSTNLKLLAHFFDIESQNIKNDSPFFNLKIFQEKEFCEKNFSQYPVILIDMKSATGDSYNEIENNLKKIMERNFQLLSSKYGLDKEDNPELNNNLEYYLFNLINTLYNRFRDKKERKVIVLIDEYEVPLQSAYETNDPDCYNKVFKLMSDIFCNALKSNDFLEKVCMTGVLSIGTRIFSNFYNYSHSSVMNKKYKDKFGFTEEEVEDLLNKQKITSPDLKLNMELLRNNYNGYLIGTIDNNCKVFNPWSVMQAISDDNISSYWINTGSATKLKLLCLQSRELDLTEFDLIFSTHFNKEIKFEVTLNENGKLQLYSILLQCGYLTFSGKISDNPNKVCLCIPNQEVFNSLSKLYISLIREKIKFTAELQKVKRITDSLLNLELVEFKEQLENTFLSSFSFCDYEKHNEKVYQSFIFELLADFYGTQITCNKDSGLGRFDIRIKTQTNLFIIELKANEKLIEGVREAMEQIIIKMYDCERSDNTKNIIHIGICFHGKQCLVNYRFQTKIDNKYKQINDKTFISEIEKK